MAEWTSVKERLPDKNGLYLCCYDAGGGHWYITIRSFTNNLEEVSNHDFYKINRPGWYDFDFEYGYFERKNIEYWMKLPEPPKEI